MRVEFTEKNITYVVRMEGVNFYFRDKAHLGGPWSRAVDYVNDKGIRLSFRRALQKAIDQLKRGL